MIGPQVLGNDLLLVHFPEMRNLIQDGMIETSILLI